MHTQIRIQYKHSTTLGTLLLRAIFFLFTFCSPVLHQVSLSLPSAELSSKLGWVPSFVVKALGYRDDWGLRAKVLELLDAYIVPKRESPQRGHTSYHVERVEPIISPVGRVEPAISQQLFCAVEQETAVALARRLPGQ